MTSLTQALQTAASERVDVATMRLDVVRNGGRLDRAGSEAPLTSS
jgi:hypothetical protein